MRTARWAAAAAAIAVGVLAGCAGIDTTAQPGAAEDATSVESADETTSSEEAAATTEAPEPTTPPAELGTRENPAAVGVDVGTFSSGSDDEIAVSLGAATWDANAIVAGENQFNDPPAEGMVFVLLPVTVSYTGPESVLPWVDVQVTYLAANGRSFERTFGVIPDDLSDVSDIYDGGTATGNILFEVPADQTTGGLWGVSYSWSDELWWEAS